MGVGGLEGSWEDRREDIGTGGTVGRQEGSWGDQAGPDRVSMVKESTHNLGVGDNAAAVGGGESGGAGFTVPRHMTLLGGTAHRESVDAVGVAITVAVVIVQATIARRPDEERA